MISKDRNGGLRQFGKVLESGLTHIGDLSGDATDGAPLWRFFAPFTELVRESESESVGATESGPVPPEKIRDYVVAVRAHLKAMPGSSGRQVRANVEGRDTSINSALEWLASNGFATTEEGPKRATLYTLTEASDA